MSHQKHVNAGFHHLFHLSMNKEMLEVCLFQIFMNLGRNLMVLSLIYYMYATLGYEIWQVAGYFVINQLGYTVMAPFIGYFLARFGVKHALGIRALGQIFLYLSILNFMSPDFWGSMFLLIPFLVFNGFAGTASNFAYDIFLAYHLNKETRGKSIAWLKIAITVGAMIAPILGGFITKFFGYGYTTVFGVVSLIIAWSVLMISKDEKFKIPYNSKKLLHDAIEETPKSLFYSEFGRVFFDSVLVVVWPLFLIFVISDIASIGLIAGLSSGFAMVLAFWIGKSIDAGKDKPRRILKHASFRSVLLNIIRGLWWEPVVLGVIDSLNKVNNQTLQVPYEVELYRWIHRKDSIERSHIRQIVVQLLFNIPYILFVLVFAFLYDGSPIVFIAIFVLGALALGLTSNVSKLNDDESTSK